MTCLFFTQRECVGDTSVTHLKKMCHRVLWAWCNYLKKVVTHLICHMSPRKRRRTLVVLSEIAKRWHINAKNYYCTKKREEKKHDMSPLYECTMHVFNNTVTYLYYFNTRVEKIINMSLCHHIVLRFFILFINVHFFLSY